ncbi:hypothetical protein, partial [Escherichia coli]|uniref:hypothetical protein n=1 Tax=Escherichia coli TaxID=562 RepID=UPI00201AAD7B
MSARQDNYFAGEKRPLVQLRALNARLLGVRMRLAAQYICSGSDITPEISTRYAGNDSNLLIVFYVQIMPDDLVMQLHR